MVRIFFFNFLFYGSWTTFRLAGRRNVHSNCAKLRNTLTIMFKFQKKNFRIELLYQLYTRVEASISSQTASPALQMMRYWSDFNIGMLSLIPLSSLCSEVVLSSILVWNCIQIVFELAASKYSCSRNSYCLLTSFWPETRQETHTRNKKLVFSSFVSPIIRWTQHEFWETKNPKLVFYRTNKEWS